MSDKMTGRLVGIGVGPGDHDLLTLRAIRTLSTLDVVFVPQASLKKESLAWEIAREHIPEDCRVETLLFPMTRSKSDLEEHWRRAAEPVAERLMDGDDCGFLTLGDPMLYSTFIYLREAVGRLAIGAVFESIPGISAGSAAASKLGLPLACGDESIAYITGERADRLEALVDEFDTIIVMKVGKRLADISERLAALGLAEKTVLARNIGLEGESLGPLPKDGLGGRAGYMSTLIIRCGNE